MAIAFENCPNCLSSQPISAEKCGECGYDIGGASPGRVKFRLVLRTMLITVLGIAALAAAAFGGYEYSENQRNSRQIEDLKGQVSALSDKIDQIHIPGAPDTSSELEEITDKIDALQSDVDEINSNVDEIETKTRNIEGDIESIQLKIGY